MKITFMGTKGYIEENSLKHRYHSSLLIEYKRFRLLVDHGLLSHKLILIKPQALLITHGHPDACKWVEKDEPYSSDIYVTRETKKLFRFQKKLKVFSLNHWFKVGPFHVMAYRVIHSLRAPAVGYKIKANKTLIYNSDLVAPRNKSVLKNVDLYIGDGSSVQGNLVRRNKAGELFGHARISTQLHWCQRYNIKNVIITHFGKEALRLSDKNLLQRFSHPDFNFQIAVDGMSLKL